ncbi:MAG: Txe/YoeB family addiction module toxin [Planctomycetaceae bacterium]|jgi:toxin YoeB|nr:Txe/YoeB family addiction module toxin [Planctomycetaceae bacterium]
MNKIFSNEAWEEYLFWQLHDKKILKRINMLLKDIDRNRYSGIGKPEPLKNLQGFWSRRIDDKNRLVYKIEKDHIVIVQCGSHYEQH